MSSKEWLETTLGELITFQRGHDLTVQNSSYGKYPVVGSNGIIAYHNEFTTQAPCLTVGRSGNSAGTPHFYDKDCWAHNTTLYVKKFHTVDPKFIYYYLKTLDLKQFASGSAVPTLNRNHIHPIKVRVPRNIKEQRRIACVLSSLDDKIELNNAINKNLDEMAQALFKRWFVDFEFPNDNGEPYKSSGGEFEESELGLIPNGWKIGNFQDLITDTLGGDWGKETPQGNYTQEVSCIRGADIPEIATGSMGKVPQRFTLLKNAAKKSLSHGDIIIEISGGSPTQSTGRTAFIIDEVLNKFSSPLICTNFCRVIKPISDYAEYLYCHLIYLYNEDIFFQYENGTTGIKNLDIGSLFSVHKIAIPTQPVLLQFASHYLKMYSMIQHLGRETDQLAQIRDTLLPKLMSGDIRVPVDQESILATRRQMVAEESEPYNAT
ncbi:restriction endonuclease subunit S [Brevibacillus invocatus]|uniref:restriction endonuclease subunit S n=1 Tax=Brevibacillus invocatus TaxID=173959 RepID=UPI00203F215B|nr:restriction endonuclease subunit S [Brevibacillus invocatus]MCM3081685.1 restriction endonuclease subunit S [Brevibacillus invocatus]MCM3432093.1 restriction endonuclease subunit S [Brevibacillus invocatus]